MIEVELRGARLLAGRLPAAELRELCELSAARLGVDDGHVAVEIVEEPRIAELNATHRGRHEPTDVLSFPIDGAGGVAGPRELGDVVICPEHAADLDRATVHGVLHLCGYDHEADEGEMLALESAVMQTLRPGDERR
jgi:probable rRNA maturation factor